MGSLIADLGLSVRMPEDMGGLVAGNVVIHRLVEGAFEFGNALPFEGNQAVDALYLPEEDIVGFAERHRSGIAFVGQGVYRMEPIFVFMLPVEADSHVNANAKTNSAAGGKNDDDIHG